MQGGKGKSDTLKVHHSSAIESARTMTATQLNFRVPVVDEGLGPLNHHPIESDQLAIRICLLIRKTMNVPDSRFLGSTKVVVRYFRTQCAIFVGLYLLTRDYNPIYGTHVHTSTNTIITGHSWATVPAL